MEDLTIMSAMCNLARKLSNKEFGLRLEQIISNQAIDYIAESSLKSVKEVNNNVSKKKKG